MITYFFKPGKRRRKKRAFLYFSFGKDVKLKLIFTGVTVLIVLTVIAVAVDLKIRPFVNDSVGNALKNKMTLTVNDAVSCVLSENAIDYTELVTVEKDNNGSVTSITSNSVKMNLFKADISKKVSDYLGESHELTVSIPLGTLTGSEVLSGRGADVKINAELFGFTVTDFKSTFESAGINQTRHSLYITIKASAYAHAGAVRVSNSIETDILIAETVIVGAVPQGYFSNETANTS